MLLTTYMLHYSSKNRFPPLFSRQLLLQVWNQCSPVHCSFKINNTAEINYRSLWSCQKCFIEGWLHWIYKLEFLFFHKHLKMSSSDKELGFNIRLNVRVSVRRKGSVNQGKTRFVALLPVCKNWYMRISWPGQTLTDKVILK